MYKLNKTNLMLCIFFSMLAYVLHRHILNNLDTLIQLKLIFLFSFMGVTYVISGMIAVYFLVISVEKMDLLDYFYESMWDAVCRPNRHIWFIDNACLCTNFMSFQKHLNIKNRSMESLKQQYKDAGLDSAYPFNVNSSEYANEVVYQNIKRLEWIKNHVPK